MPIRPYVLSYDMFREHFFQLHNRGSYDVDDYVVDDLWWYVFDFTLTQPLYYKKLILPNLLTSCGNSNNIKLGDTFYIGRLNLMLYVAHIERARPFVWFMRELNVYLPRFEIGYTFTCDASNRRFMCTYIESNGLPHLREFTGVI